MHERFPNLYSLYEYTIHIKALFVDTYSYNNYYVNLYSFIYLYRQLTFRQDLLDCRLVSMKLILKAQMSAC